MTDIVSGDGLSNNRESAGEKSLLSRAYPVQVGTRWVVVGIYRNRCFSFGKRRSINDLTRKSCNSQFQIIGLYCWQAIVQHHFFAGRVWIHFYVLLLLRIGYARTYRVRLAWGGSRRTPCAVSPFTASSALFLFFTLGLSSRRIARYIPDAEVLIIDTKCYGAGRSMITTGNCIERSQLGSV